MKKTDLLSFPKYIIPENTLISRIQKKADNASRFGFISVPNPGSLSGRFDLISTATAYFTYEPITAVYEAICRRDAPRVSLAALQKKEIISVATTCPMNLLDTRDFTSDFPVLQSLNFGKTQEVAKFAHGEKLMGIIYRSAQQYGCDCIVLFENAIPNLKLISSDLIVNIINGDKVLHETIHAALKGSCLNLVP